MKLLRYFEGQEIKDARRATQDLQALLAIAKRDQRRSEEGLRQTLTRVREELDRQISRQPIAGALTGRRTDAG